MFCTIVFQLLLSSYSNYSQFLNDDEPLLDSTENYLAMYGKYVFEREKCSRCHSFTPSKKKEIIQLDGMQTKFTNSWHYLHFIEPQYVNPTSKMPSFAFLEDKIIQESTFLEIVKKNNGIGWMILNKQADEILETIPEHVSEINEKNELIALIAFLNAIPKSEALRIKDSLYQVELREIEKQWIDLMQDTSSIVYTTLNDKKSINLGKKIYSSYCTPCHGQEGEGVIGPNLTDQYWLHGGKTVDLLKTMIYGIPEKGMRSWKYEFTPIQLAHIIAYIKSIQGSNPNNAKNKQGLKE